MHKKNILEQHEHVVFQGKLCSPSPTQHGTRPKLAFAQEALHLKESCQENQEKPFLFKPEIQLQTLISSACKSKLGVLFFNATIQGRTRGRHGAAWGQVTHTQTQTPHMQIGILTL